MYTYWKDNKESVCALARLMGIKRIQLCDDVFVAGSMFLCRSAALRPLLAIPPSQLRFEEELGQHDGTMAHAIERAFTYSVMAAGFKVAHAENRKAIKKNFARFGSPWESFLYRASSVVEKVLRSGRAHLV